jgi:hypothetical protein
MEDVTKMADEINEKIDGFKQQLENGATKEDLAAIKTEIEGIKSDNTTKELLEEIQEKLSVMEERGNSTDKKNKTFRDEVLENMDVIKSIVNGDNKEVVIKANTTRASIAGNTEAVRLGDIGQLGVKERSLYNLFPKIPVSTGNHNGVIKYIDWDEASIVRAAAAVAEGAAFPESTAAFQEYSIPLRKIGDTLPVTEEFGEDEVTAAAELEMFLDVNVQTEIDQQLATGDGTGQNLLGLMSSVPAYTPVASGITDANIYDLVKKVKTAIVFSRGSKYSPNFVAMTSNTADELHLKKDANNNYIFPDVMNIGAMAIVIDNNLPENQLVVGDSRYARIYEMGGVEISRGLVNAQFTSDLQTIKARKRMLFLIREVDKTGFLKVTDIDAALATLAT